MVRKPSNELSKEAGILANRIHVKKCDYLIEQPPRPLLWKRHISVPFSYAVSKNNMYAFRGHGRVGIKRESRACRNHITRAMQAALRDQRVAHNKVWIEILVQKPNHKGDAVNVIDLVCDALKDAMPVDDRWYCIRVLDWHIVKENPRLHITIGQTTDEDAQVCSCCGLIKTLDQFSKSKSHPLGVGYKCLSCRREGRALAKDRSS
ncbi:MAG: RusA family crossover junction endodeoxyribonuclease [Planctomycetes bacterium]|nr:RusA family crossover junction endodeoxyribonuclease [Planctomycetota bacterium]